MASANWRRSLERIGSRCLTPVTLAAFLLAFQPTLAQQGNVEHWVGTWATACVGRPQYPAAPALPPVPPPPLPPLAQPPATPPAAFMHFNNQTLRQIVHTSIGGPRVRVVVSNVFGTAALTVGGAHIALR